MFASTILLRRLFTRRPSPQELEFHWWFLTCGGINEWHRYLASKGFRFSRRNRVIRIQEKVARKVLETWATEQFYQWVNDPRQHPQVRPDVLTPEVLGGISGVGEAPHEVHHAEFVPEVYVIPEPDHHQHEYWQPEAPQSLSNRRTPTLS